MRSDISFSHRGPTISKRERIVRVSKPVIRSVVRIEQPSTKCWSTDMVLSSAKRISPSCLSRGSSNVSLQARQRYRLESVSIFPKFLSRRVAGWAVHIKPCFVATRLKCSRIVKNTLDKNTEFYFSLEKDVQFGMMREM